MIANNKKMELSYYGLLLFSYLKESHPDKLNDTAFIESRSDLAAATFENAIKEGYKQPYAAELANEVLFNGLHFSKHDTIVEILWNEFAEEIPEEKAIETAIQLQPHLERIFEKYPLSDDFADSSDFELLYTELTGNILLYFDENGI